MKLTNRKLFYASVFISCYFILLTLNEYLMESEHVMVGVVRELFTIPLLILQLVLLFIAIKRWVTEDSFSVRKLPFWAALFLLINNSWTLGLFFTTRF